MSCPTIQFKFWKVIESSMNDLNLAHINTKRFWVTGQINLERKHSHTCREGAAIIVWAWRALYAELIGARLNNTQPNFARAIFITLRYAVTRIKAHGKHWKEWYVKQRHHLKGKTFPKQHQEKKLIQQDDEAFYDLSQTLIDKYNEARDNYIASRRR